MSSEGHYFLALVITRKVTTDGAVLVSQRLFSPRGVLSATDFAPLPRERNWCAIMNVACRECKLPDFYMLPDTEVLVDDELDGELATMVYPIELNGPVADLFHAMDGIVTSSGVPSDVFASVSKLMAAIGVFDDALIAAFTALSAKVRCLKIPPVIPLGKSELDMYEEAHPVAAAPAQAEAS